jgi:hypothetical protein
VSAYAPMAGLALHQGLGGEIDGSTPADQAYAEDVTDLREARHIIAQLRRAVVQDTELTCFPEW